MRLRRGTLRARPIAVSLALFLAMGAVVPALAPAEGVVGGMRRMVALRVTEVLFWADMLFLPASVPDGITMAVNAATCALWGLVAGVAWCILVPGGRQGAPKEV